MANGLRGFCLIVLILMWISTGLAADLDLQYFLGKAASKSSGLSKPERTELLNRVREAMEQAQKICTRLNKAIQSGEVDIRFHEAKFWISKLETGEKSIEAGMEQLKILTEKPSHLVASVKLYKFLKDLSSNLSAYNNNSSFSSYVGDLAPEVELWSDPVFYQLYLLPLAQSKNVEVKLPPEPKSTTREKKPSPKVKKPQ